MLIAQNISPVSYPKLAKLTIYKPHDEKRHLSIILLNLCSRQQNQMSIFQSLKNCKKGSQIILFRLLFKNLCQNSLVNTLNLSGIIPSTNISRFFSKVGTKKAMLQFLFWLYLETKYLCIVGFLYSQFVMF